MCGTRVVSPLVRGGGQENGFRPGTENTPMIAGLGAAAELVSKQLHTYTSHMQEVRDYLLQQLKVSVEKWIAYTTVMVLVQLTNSFFISILGVAYIKN